MSTSGLMSEQYFKHNASNVTKEVTVLISEFMPSVHACSTCFSLSFAICISGLVTKVQSQFMDTSCTIVTAKYSA